MPEAKAAPALLTPSLSSFQSIATTSFSFRNLDTAHNSTINSPNSPNSKAELMKNALAASTNLAQDLTRVSVAVLEIVMSSGRDPTLIRKELADERLWDLVVDELTRIQESTEIDDGVIRLGYNLAIIDACRLFGSFTQSGFGDRQTSANSMLQPESQRALAWTAFLSARNDD